MNKVGVKFTYYRMGTTISRMTDYEKIEELYDHGIEQVALECLDEIYRALNIDLTKLSYPYPATKFCFFSESSYHSNHSISEENRTPVIENRNVEKELVY